MFVLASWRTRRRESRSSGTSSDTKLSGDGLTGDTAATASDAECGRRTVRDVGPAAGSDIQDGPIMYEGRWNRLLEDGICEEKWRKLSTA